MIFSIDVIWKYGPVFPETVRGRGGKISWSGRDYLVLVQDYLILVRDYMRGLPWGAAVVP